LDHPPVSFEYFDMEGIEDMHLLGEPRPDQSSI
jgi:hypothetical protein